MSQDICSQCKKTKCIKCNLKILGELDVKCNTTLEKDLTVLGTTTLNDVTANDLNVQNVIVNQDLSVNGSSTFQDIDVKGNALFEQDVTIQGSATLNDVNANVLCLNDQLAAPPCSGSANDACLWVAGPTTANPSPPLVTDRDADVLHYQDNECRDNVVNMTPTDPFHGWWVATLKGGVFYDDTNYFKCGTVFIDTTKYPIELYAYPGTGAQARQLSPTERLGRSVAFYERVDQNTIWQPPTSATDTTVQTLRLQSDKKTLVGTVTIPTQSQGGSSFWVLTKLSNPPFLRPYGPEEYAFPDSLEVADPVFMFNEFCDVMLKEQPMTNINLGYEEYPGYQSYKNHQQQLKTIGITYNSMITKVQRTLPGGWLNLPTQNLQTTITAASNGQTLPQPIINVVSTNNYPNSGTITVLTTLAGNTIVNTLTYTGKTPTSFTGVVGGSGTMSTGGIVFLPRYITVIYTDVAHHANPFTSVTLSGFSGPSSILNGTFPVVLYENRLFFDDDPEFINPSSTTYRFAIEVDTRSLLADTNGYIIGLSGNENVSTTIGPVNPATEYRELIAAMIEQLYFAFKFSTHSNLRYYTAANDNFYCIDTFANLKSALRNNNAISRLNFAFLRAYGAGSRYYMSQKLLPIQFGTFFPNSYMDYINNPFGINGHVPTNVFAYNIPLENYLDYTIGSEPRNIWWRLTGASVTPFNQLLGQTYYGDPSIGRTFESITFPMKAGVAPPPAGGKPWMMLSNNVFGAYNATRSEAFVFGRINPALVGGQNIGYIRLSHSQWFDSLRGMVTKDFAPPGTELGNPRVNYEAACRVFSEGMKYVVTTLGCGNRIILDIRANSGVGTAADLTAVASFFGGDRKGAELIQARLDSGFSAPLDIGTYDVYNDAINQSYSFRQVLPSLSNTFYPGSVFDTSDARLYVLTDKDAQSAADWLPHYFVGDNLDGNIGAGVSVKQFGDINGILAGFTGNTQNMTTSAISFPVTVNTTFTGSITGDILTITGSVTNGPVAIEQLVQGTGVPPNTYITEYLTGTGGSGTYKVSTNAIVASTSMRVENVPVPFVRYNIENYGSGNMKMIAEPNTLMSRGTWIKPDTPLPAVNYLGAGPWPNAPEDNYYQDLGAPGATYPVPKLPGDVRPDPNLLPQWPAQPTVSDRLLWRDRWLEQTVWDALQP